MAEQFLRGSRPLAPANHIVVVTAQHGGQFFRRVSLTAVQMAHLEAQLMERQHAGDIRGYLIAAAEDCTPGELVAWVDSWKDHAQQGELISIEQNTLFSAGGAL